MVKLNMRILEEKIKLIEELKQHQYIRTKEIENAFLKVSREEFIEHKYKDHSYSDRPLELKESGQTISAPHMIAIMLEELELTEINSILEIGSGSGYNIALIAEILKHQKKIPKILTIERLPELIKFVISNLKKSGYLDMIKVILGDGTLGYPQKNESEMYDRIIVTAASPNIPEYLIKQMNNNGILLIPVGTSDSQDLLKITKINNRITKKKICECVFVKLIGEEGFR